MEQLWKIQEHFYRRGRNMKQSDYAMHMHDDYEIYCFLSGRVKYVVEGSVYELRRGDMVLVRRLESHRAIFLSDAEYRRMVVNFLPNDPEDAFVQSLLRPFCDRPAGVRNCCPAALFSNDNHLHYMECICTSEQPEVQAAYLTVLLQEISERIGEVGLREGRCEDTVCADLLRYINRHLSEELSLDGLSEQFFLSKSQLNRKFKQVMGATIWQYILGKRLLMAKDLIAEGQKPTKVYADCGFSDYPSFYRAYRARFGVTPSRTVLQEEALTAE